MRVGPQQKIMWDASAYLGALLRLTWSHLLWVPPEHPSAMWCRCEALSLGFPCQFFRYLNNTLFTSPLWESNALVRATVVVVPVRF